MWIVFGTGVKTRRVPGGARLDRHCMQCGEHATFYEKEVTATFRLYFVDVFDYQKHRVMACGCCSACYATDELGVPQTGAVTEGPTVAGYIERAAGAFEDGIASLFGHDRPAAHAPRHEEEPESTPADDEEIDPLEDPMEARFRELERKAGLRIKDD
jgi:Zn ribbon nucleic-acid-binding protein